MILNRTAEARFHRKYEVCPLTGCWLWTDAPDDDGYGRLQMGRAHVEKAHRVSWALHNGDPGDALVCHTCDTPPCVNPEHLFLGTDATNSADMIAKGRGRPGGKPLPGEANGRAVLTEAVVRDLRRRREAGERLSPTKLSRLYGVHRTTIQRVLSGRRWTAAEKHL